MSLDLNGATINGGAQFGFTSPTYTLYNDRPPSNRDFQFYVNALGGTQTNVRIHSPSDPFTITTKAPISFRQKPVVSADGIIMGNVALNEYRLLARKGVKVYSSNIRNASIDVRVSIPAGADVEDAANIRALWSLVCGIMTTHSSTLGNGTVNGTW